MTTLTQFGEYKVNSSETTESLLKKFEAARSGRPKRAGEILSITCALYLHLQG